MTDDTIQFNTSGDGSDDMSEYLQVYLDESDEELDALIDALLKLEDNPTDGAALDEGFRLLHTLKGSAGMMGFEGISTLAHQLENRFESFRSGDDQLERSTMTFLLRCVDFLREFNTKLRKGESADHDTSALVAELDQLAGEDAEASEPATAEAVGADPAEKNESEPSNVADSLADSAEGSGIRIIVRFEAGLQLADLKARLIVARLSNIGEIVATEPPIDDIASFEALPLFSLVLVTSSSPDEIRAIANVDGVNRIEFENHLAAQAEAVADPEGQIPSTPAAAEDFSSRAVSDDGKGSSPAEPATPSSEAAVRSSVAETVRVDIDRLDDLMNLTGELVVTKARFSQHTRKLGPLFKRNGSAQRSADFVERLRSGVNELRSVAADDSGSLDRWIGVLDELDTDLAEMGEQSGVWEAGRREFQQMAEAVDQLNRISDNLQQTVLETRMVPVGPLFNRFRRVIRDLAVDRTKNVQLVIRGEATELDKRMIDELGDPLIHLIRNAIDHGLEAADIREAAGKTATGTIELEATHSGNNVYINIRDDGAGIDIERVRQHLVSRDLVDSISAAQLTDHQVIEYIWHPGFSTAEKVTDVSGRGVGMDVVRNRIADLNGTIDVDSKPGQGTAFTIRLPLTLAIIRSLVVRVCGEFFSIPVDDVREIVELPGEQILSVHGMHTIDVRGEFIPVITLKETFEWRQAAESSDAKGEPVDDEVANNLLPIVILQIGDEMLGLCVDELHGGADIVIKSLADNFVSIAGLSGASVMADGTVCLMIDSNALINLASRRSRSTEHEESDV